MGYSNGLPAWALGSPAPPASGTHQPGAAPWGTKMPVKRVLGVAAVFDSGVCAGTMESRRGRANATPAPRRTARRDKCLLVTNKVYLPLQRPATPPVPPAPS